MTKIKNTYNIAQAKDGFSLTSFMGVSAVWLRIGMLFLLLGIVGGVKGQNLNLDGDMGADYIAYGDKKRIEVADGIYQNFLMPTVTPLSTSLATDISSNTIIRVGDMQFEVGSFLANYSKRRNGYEELLEELVVQQAFAELNLESTKTSIDRVYNVLKGANNAFSDDDLIEEVYDLIDQNIKNKAIAKRAKDFRSSVEKSKNLLTSIKIVNDISYEAFNYVIRMSFVTGEALERIRIIKNRYNYSNSNGNFNDPALRDAINNVEGDLQLMYNQIQNLDYESLTLQLGKISLDVMISTVQDKFVDRFKETLKKYKIVKKTGGLAVTVIFASLEDATGVMNSGLNNILFANLDYYLFYKGQANPLGYDDMMQKILDQGIVHGSDEYYLTQVRLYYNYLFANQQLEVLEGGKDPDITEPVATVNRTFTKFFNRVTNAINQLVDGDRAAAQNSYKISLKNTATLSKKYFEALNDNVSYPEAITYQVPSVPENTDPAVFPIELPLIEKKKTISQFFPDVPQDYWAFPYIDYLLAKDVVNGDQDGNFTPERLLTRGELAKLAVNGAGLTINTSGAIFDDVDSDNEFFEYVQTLKNLGYVTGVPNSNDYGVYNSITRAEVAKILSLAFGFTHSGAEDIVFPDVDSANEFFAYIHSLVERKIVYGFEDGTFKPYNNIRRAEASKIVFKCMEYKESVLVAYGNDVEISIAQNGVAPVISSITALGLTDEETYSTQTFTDVTFTVTATDPDGGDPRFIWESTHGNFSGTGTTVVWNSGDVLNEYQLNETAFITCRAMDDQGNIDEKYFKIIIYPPPTSDFDIEINLDFEIPTVNITSSVQSEYNAGDDISITWDTPTDNIGVDSIFVYYVNKRGIVDLKDLINIYKNEYTGQTSYNWTIPSINGGDFRIVVMAKDAAANLNYDVTDYFTIINTTGVGNSDNIIGAEYFIGTDPGQGNGNPLFAADGAFDSSIEEVEGTFSTSSLSVGNHIVNIRFRNGDGTWGPVFKKPFRIHPPVNLPELSSGSFPTIAAAEYFIDDDPGAGSGLALTAVDGDADEIIEEMTSVVPTAGMSEGNYLLGVRYQNSDGTWSDPYHKPFRIHPPVNLPELSSGSFPTIAAAEYFIGDDPGAGSGLALTAVDGDADEIIEVMTSVVPTAGMSEGNYLLGVRYQNSDGTWSDPYHKPFRIHPTVNLPELSSGSFPTIAAAEYFIGDDPGAGSGLALTAVDGDADEIIEEMTSVVPTAGMSEGNYLLGVRYQNSDGTWSDPYHKPFRIHPPVNYSELSLGSFPTITEAEYFIDTDPGEGLGVTMTASDGAFDSFIEDAEAIVPTNGFDEKYYLMGVRYKNSDNTWSQPFHQPFEIKNITPPAAPEKLVATGFNKKIKLTWDGNQEQDMLRYVLYRSNTAGFTPTSEDSLAHIEAGEVLWIDDDLVNGTDYYYALQAIDVAENRSEFSAIASATPVNTAPVVSLVFDAEQVLEDSDSHIISNISSHFSDIDEDELTFSAISSDLEKVVVGSIVNDELTYTLVGDAFGVATITVTASDGLLSVNAEISIIIEGQPDTPVVITSIGNRNLLEDFGAAVIVDDLNTVFGDVDGETLTFTADTDNAAITATINGNRLSLAAGDHIFGTATITTKATDPTGRTVNEVFTVKVTAVNDAPTFVVGTDIMIAEDLSAQTISGWATSISSGPSNENNQELNFSLSTDNDQLFDVLPIINVSGDLSFTPKADAFGVAMITIQLQDNGGVDHGGIDSNEQQFRLTINNINDAPVLEAVQLSIAENSVQGSLVGTIEGADVDADVLSYSIASGNILGGFALSSSGELTVNDVSVLDFETNPTFSLEVEVNDGALNATTTVTINLEDVNEVPTLA
ncbi:MAG: S-layer homology domain-containing protein, partial [Cyclobacteriaceae bacterium]